MTIPPIKDNQPLKRSDTAPMEASFPMKRGHFVLESGHHGDLWLDLELLFSTPQEARTLTKDLAPKLDPFRPEWVVAPLVEGAFVGLYVAESLGVRFGYSERGAPNRAQSLFPY